MASDVSSLNSSSSSSSSSGTTNSASSLAENFDTFLTILTTQLQNQDPLSPLDTHEFTNQLVMFAGAEQSVKQSSLLEDLIDLNQSNEAIGAVSYLGNTVEAEGNIFSLSQGSDKELGYILPEEASNAAIQIFNSTGNMVHIESVDKTAGKHSFTWDGKDADGNNLPAGSYSFLIGAVDDNDAAITATTLTNGKVTGVETGSSGTTLVLDDLVDVPIDQVKAVKQS